MAAAAGLDDTPGDAAAVRRKRGAGFGCQDDRVRVLKIGTNRISDRMAEAFLTKDSFEWERLFGEAGAPGAAHRTTEEWLQSPHPRAAGLLVDVSDAEYGHDDLVQASTGVMERFGGGMASVEEHAHFGTIDVLGGLCAALATALALLRREETGTGDVARTSLAAAGQWLQVRFMHDYFMREERHPLGRAVEHIDPTAIRPLNAGIVPVAAAVKYGADTRRVLVETGYSAGEIDALLVAGVISESWSESYLPN